MNSEVKAIIVLLVLTTAITLVTVLSLPFARDVYFANKGYKKAVIPSCLKSEWISPDRAESALRNIGRN